MSSTDGLPYYFFIANSSDVIFDDINTSAQSPNDNPAENTEG